MFVNAGNGVLGTSENGTSADSWAPRASRISGLRRHARLFDVDVIINANTPELCGQQYISMMLERAMVARVPEQPELFQMFPSSEVTPHWIAPHIRPTWLFRSIEHGEVIASAPAVSPAETAQARSLREVSS